ncbi:MAG: hypothetical protein QOD29_2429 [Alphaproteobacteria bacterium]|nr:hypothetical protein [Alphaproteobacteria bacterium]
MLRPAMVRVLTLLIVGSLLTSCGVLEPAGDILLTLRLKSAEGRFTWASNRLPKPVHSLLCRFAPSHHCSNFAPSSRLRFCLRLRLPHGQDRALDFGLDPGILVNGHMIEADVAAEIDVRQLATIADIGSYGRAPAR